MITDNQKSILETSDGSECTLQFPEEGETPFDLENNVRRTEMDYGRREGGRQGREKTERKNGD